MLCHACNGYLGAFLTFPQHASLLYFVYFVILFVLPQSCRQWLILMHNLYFFFSLFKVSFVCFKVVGLSVCMLDRWYNTSFIDCRLISFIVSRCCITCFLPVTRINTSYSLRDLMTTFSIFKTVDERPFHGGLSYQLVSVKTLPLFLEDDRFQPTA